MTSQIDVRLDYSEYADLVNKTFSIEGSIALEQYKWDTHTNIKRSLEKIELETVNIFSELKSANSLYDEYESIKASDSSLPPNLLQDITKSTTLTNREIVTRFKRELSNLIAALEFSYEAMETHDEYTSLSKDLQNLNKEIETSKISADEGDAALNAFQRHFSKLANKNEYNINLIYESVGRYLSIPIDSRANTYFGDTFICVNTNPHKTMLSKWCILLGLKKIAK